MSECNVDRVADGVKMPPYMIIGKLPKHRCHLEYLQEGQPENMPANLYLSHLKLYLLSVQVFRIEEYVLKIILVFSIFPLNSLFFPQKI